jgi:hypothetical protein
MKAKSKYVVGVIAAGPVFDLGYRFAVIAVIGPRYTVVGHFMTEKEAQDKADSLNREEPS